MALRLYTHFTLTLILHSSLWQLLGSPLVALILSALHLSQERDTVEGFQKGQDCDILLHRAVLLLERLICTSLPISKGKTLRLVCLISAVLLKHV